LACARYMKAKPDFYLTSSEWRVLKNPRKCWILNRFEYRNRDDLFLVKLNTPIIYEDKQEGTVELKKVVIASRHEGFSVQANKEWPVYVHLARLKKELPPHTKRLDDKDIENVAWGEIYPTLMAAQQGMTRQE
jgi:hypothetical protein